MSDKKDVSLKCMAIINEYLDQFVGKGLYGTITKDLSKVLKLQSVGMYSYFENKVDTIVVCAESVAVRLGQ